MICVEGRGKQVLVASIKSINPLLLSNVLRSLEDLIVILRPGSAGDASKWSLSYHSPNITDARLDSMIIAQWIALDIVQQAILRFSKIHPCPPYGVRSKGIASTRGVRKVELVANRGLGKESRCSTTGWESPHEKNHKKKF